MGRRHESPKGRVQRCPAVPQQPDRHLTEMARANQICGKTSGAFVPPRVGLHQQMSTPATTSGKASAGNRRMTTGLLVAALYFPDDAGSKLTESVTMATFHLPTRRLILAGGFVVAIAAAPAVAVFATPTTGGSAPSITACPGGETEDQFTNICVPDIVPNSPGFQSTSPVGGFLRSAASLAPDAIPASASAWPKNSRPKAPLPCHIRR